MTGLVSHVKDGVAQPLLERWVVAELLEQFRVIGQQINYNPLQRGVVFDPCGLLIVVLHGVLVGRVCRHLERNFLRNYLSDFVSILPRNIAELVVERTAQLLLGFPGVEERVVLQSLGQTVVALHRGVVLQHIEDEALLDGLFHGVAVERVVLHSAVGLRVRIAEDLQGLVLGGRSEGKIAGEGKSPDIAMHRTLYKITQTRIKSTITQIMTGYKRFPDVSLFASRVVNQNKLDTAQLLQRTGNRRSLIRRALSAWRFEPGNGHDVRQLNEAKVP